MPCSGVGSVSRAARHRDAPVRDEGLHQGLCRRCTPPCCHRRLSWGRCRSWCRCLARLRESARVVVKGRRVLRWSAGPTATRLC